MSVGDSVENMEKEKPHSYVATTQLWGRF